MSAPFGWSAAMDQKRQALLDDLQGYSRHAAAKGPRSDSLLDKLFDILVDSDRAHHRGEVSVSGPARMGYASWSRRRIR